MDEYVFQGSPQKMTSFRGPRVLLLLARRLHKTHRNCTIVARSSTLQTTRFTVYSSLATAFAQQCNTCYGRVLLLLTILVPRATRLIICNRPATTSKGFRRRVYFYITPSFPDHVTKKRRALGTSWDENGLGLLGLLNLVPRGPVADQKDRGLWERDWGLLRFAQAPKTGQIRHYPLANQRFLRSVWTQSFSFPGPVVSWSRGLETWVSYKVEYQKHYVHFLFP